MAKMKFLLVGDEARQIYLYNKLKMAGHDVKHIMSGNDKELNGKQKYDAVLLPIPNCQSEFEKVKCFLSGNEYVFGCNLQKENTAVAACESQESFHFIEYMKSDEVAYKNAVATAEGSIAEAIALSDINLHGSESLIVGFGRCAQVLSAKLKALNSRVTVMERDKAKRARAEAYGYMTADFTEADYSQCSKYNFVFNTVPAMVVNENILSRLQRDVTIIDIASKPGGVDYKYCRENKINAVNALGLPGKFAPKTSADILYDVISSEMNL